MSNVLKHRFTSPKLDGPDATQVQPSAWNDGHQFSGGANGQVLTRDTSDATFGAAWTALPAAETWTAYTPQWYLNGVLTAPGTHALTGSYWLRGNFVAFQFKFVVGSAAIGAGGWEFTLPLLPVAHLTPGAGLLLTTAGWPLWGFLSGTRVLLLAQPVAGALGLFSATSPVTLAAGHSLEIRGHYQAA